MAPALRSLLLLYFAGGCLWGQSSALLRGEVVDPQKNGVAGARVTLRNLSTGFSRVVQSDASGGFLLTNIPFQSYTLLVEKTGFQVHESNTDLRNNIPQTLTVSLELAGATTSVQVVASDVLEAVDTQATGTRTELNMEVMSRIPTPAGNRGLEPLLLSLPGFAANANGAIHPRGAHNQMTFVIDGVPISDQLTGAFANSVDPSIVQTLELFTGDIPVEYGSKVSGVAVVTTRSGMGTGRKFSGSTQAFGGSFDTFGQVTQAAGGGERWGYFSSVSTLQTHRFLDQVSLDNLHNGGNSQRAFGRLDYQLSAGSQLRINMMSGRSSFELANLRSQQASGQKQRQTLRDAAVSVGYLRTLSPAATWDSNVSYRTSIAQLFGSAGDTPIIADQARHLSTATASTRVNYQRGRNSVRAGLDAQYFPVSENFSFGITRSSFNDPASSDFVETLLPYDLTRGGSRFQFHDRQAGRLYSGFVQDTIRLGSLTLNVGLRYDRYRFLTAGNQLQPRAGLAYFIAKTGTVLRASYNRTYQTPPNENLLLSSSEQTAVLVPAAVRNAVGSSYALIRPERQNVFEAGFQQALGGLFSLMGAAYHKNSRDMQDNDNFLNTGVIFPTSLLRSRTNGAEMRLMVLPKGRLTGSVSLTHYHTIVTPPFTGGLFLGSAALDVLSAGPFVIDHDQKLGVHGIVQYYLRRHLWVSGSVRYDSGLVSNPSMPEEVARDPDFADLLPYVNLLSSPARVRPRTVADIGFGYEHLRGDKKNWDAVVQVSNLTDTTALYNFQSIFVGTRLVSPRAVSLKLRWFF